MVVWGPGTKVLEEGSGAWGYREQVQVPQRHVVGPGLMSSNLVQMTKEKQQRRAGSVRKRLRLR
jgi:hypothetical protein